LPSIRQLATEIKVSIITVKRAYLVLERKDVIVSQQGKPSRVNGNMDL
jgi:GntR family transcriptional regulator